MVDKVQEAVAKMVANLEANTGSTLEQWHHELAKNGFTSEFKHGEIMKYLKIEGGVSHGFANLIASRFREASQDSDTDLIDKQYGGTKSALRPIYKQAIELVSSLGQDVVIAPKKSYVSIRRNKQFALIQASTKSRLDIGINLPSISPTKRLEASGSFNTMVSHRVRLTTLSEIDDELKRWLQLAYEKA